MYLSSACTRLKMSGFAVARLTVKNSRVKMRGLALLRSGLAHFGPLLIPFPPATREWRMALDIQGVPQWHQHATSVARVQASEITFHTHR